MVDLGRPTATVPSRGYQLWVTDVVVVIVAGVFVAIRLVSRYLRSGIQVDDWTILAALVLSVLFSTTQNVAVGYGFGKHDWDITDEQEKKSLKWILVAQVLYKLVICLAKVSILLLYLRIFYVHQYFRRICICLVVFTILSGIAFIPPTIWQCSPVEAYWDRSIPHTCLSSFPNWLSYAIINITTNVILLVLPVQQILRLQLTKRDKIALILVFLLGSFVCITSIYRVTLVAASSGTTDVTWATTPISSWSAVEVNSGIICACLPMARQTLSHVFSCCLPPQTTKNSSISPSQGYNNNSAHFSRISRSGKPVSGTGLNRTGHPWEYHPRIQDGVVLTSIQSDRHRHLCRSDSEEVMLGQDCYLGNGGGIVKRTDVSIIEHSRAS
ncbi:putative Plasma membrane protein Pth11-like [Trichophyton interdigitale]|uniref:Plasma membrane protein Pth11-like n=1 Tax=Trichophyton interdigitale TaxID=101480 RepID=A0A9P4YIM4_9EURO|nr:putative Plasma membrane protein Pth11-like [Trichophyton interdigitale]KAF3899170.1 putative Plasma membrane protein Pth11-like [Trichophyton interdigitale]KAG8208929.1 putative Plasma membrane protein Pth11-like [Trichophyton interdigitale]